MRWRARAPNIAISVRTWLAYFIYSYAALPVASGQRIRKSAAAQNPGPPGYERALLYPDLVVVCGAPQFHDAYRDVLLNPTVIIEVLSPSTEAFDRGEKFWRYRTWLPALTNYLLVSQTLPLTEHYVRQANDTWNLTTVSTMEAAYIWRLLTAHCDSGKSMTASIFRAKYLSLLTKDSFGSHALKVVVDAAAQPL